MKSTLVNPINEPTHTHYCIALRKEGRVGSTTATLPPLKLNFAFSPYFSDATALEGGAHSARAWLANTHFYLAFFFLQGHFWHALRGMGFNFKRVSEALDNMGSSKVSA